MFYMKTGTSTIPSNKYNHKNNSYNENNNKFCIDKVMINRIT